MFQLAAHDLGQWRTLAEKSGYSAKLVCKELNVSRRQLERYTHALFGISPQRWLHKERLIAASELLRHESSIKSVSFRLGFRWPSHFSREFKLYHGRSPKAFLRQCRSLLPGGDGDPRDAPPAFCQSEFVFK
jgi:AraC-like DNA-binding protein